MGQVASKQLVVPSKDIIQNFRTELARMQDVSYDENVALNYAMLLVLRSRTAEDLAKHSRLEHPTTSCGFHSIIDVDRLIYKAAFQQFVMSLADRLRHCKLELHGEGRLRLTYDGAIADDVILTLWENTP